MKRISCLCVLIVTLISCTENTKTDKNDIVIENGQVKLIISKEGTSKSLLFKPTNEECLTVGEKIPKFSIGQERPYHNETKLSHPCREMVFQANAVRTECIRNIEMMIGNRESSGPECPGGMAFTTYKDLVAKYVPGKEIRKPGIVGWAFISPSSIHVIKYR